MRAKLLPPHIKLMCGVSVIVGVAIWLLVLLRKDTQSTDFFLPKLFIKALSPVCDSIVGDLTNDIEAGLGLNILTGEVFWEKTPDKPCRIASLTKLMVVLITMEKVGAGELGLSGIITVTRESSKMGGSQVYLKEGETIQLTELLKAMMISSANDASYLIAQHIGGTEENFVRMMNDKARSMGLNHTYFSNSTGLPPEEDESHNVSSCIDMAYIALKIIEYPEVMDWASTEVDYIRNGEFKLKTWNTLLKRCDFIDGLKTGYYRDAGWNIVATSINGEQKVMAIVLGAKSPRARDRTAKSLIEYALHNH